MGNLKEIKNRQASVKSISQITKAMKMIASSKISKAESMVKAGVPYAEQLVYIMGKIAENTKEISHPLLEKRSDVKNVGILIITSDKGLCGSYNTNIMKMSSNFCYELKLNGKNPIIYILGTKAKNYYDRRKIPYKWGKANWVTDCDFADEMYLMFAKDFKENVFDEFHIIYASAKSKASYKVKNIQYLPFVPEIKEENSSKKAGNCVFEPSTEMAVNLLVPMALKQLLLTALLDARYSEYGARIVAMTNATDSAEKLSDELRLSFFRARQEAITTEILEISSAAAQLSKS